MAYNEDIEDDGFSIMTDQEENDNTIDDELFGNPKPKASTKGVTPASEEDKAKARETGKAETEEEKAAKVLEAKQAEAKRIKEEEENLFDEDVNESKVDSKTKTKEETPVGELDEIEAFAKDLYTIGLLSPDEEGVEPTLPKTNQELIDALDNEAEKRADSKIYDLFGKHGEEYRTALEAITVDGVNPLEYLHKFESVKTFKDMDLTIEDNQIKVVETSLRKQGWEEEDISKKIKSLKLNAELETESLSFHKALVKQEERELVKIQEKSRNELAAREAAEKQYTSNIRSILVDKIKAKEFDGIPVTKEAATKVADFLDNKKWKLSSGELITDFDYAILELNKPQNHATKVKLGLLLAPLFQPNKPITLDLSKVAKTAVSQEKKELFEFTKRNKIKVTNIKEKEDHSTDWNFD